MMKQQNISKKVFCFICALFSTCSLNVRNTLYVGNCVENKLGNIFSRLYSVFDVQGYTDIILFVALYVFFYWGLKTFNKISISGIIVSGILSIMQVFAIFYRNYNSTEFIWCDSFQRMIALFEVLGIGIIIYFVIHALDYFLNNQSHWCKVNEATKVTEILKKHFFVFSFVFIFVCWLFWLIISYPGSTNPDTVIQLKNFYNDMPRTAWQPPFSTFIMGGLFHIGKMLINANFGIFLYNLFQGVVGALVFSFALSRLSKRDVPFIIPALGTIFFGLVPMWGAYVQWFEKDFLYTVSVVLFVALVVEVIFDKKCGKKMLLCLCLSGIIMALLRNNGIYVIVPTLIGTVIYTKGIARKRLLAALIIVFGVYESIVNAVYPLMGIGKGSVAETIGVMFQASARYVQEYPEELTEYEKEVLAENFQALENLGQYNPRIIDPVKIYYNHSDFGAYVDIWIDMFFKHPYVYLESFLNGAYGYMAPVVTDIGAYITQGSYDPYLEELGISHVENGNINYMATRLLDLNNALPVFKHLVSPGLYTWITIVALWLMLKNKKKEAILLIPNLVNILVCALSPLADAMRYALPTVAVIPLVIGWLFVVLGKNNVKREEGMKVKEKVAEKEI